MYIYTYMYTYIYACMCVYTQIHVCICVCVCVFAHVYIYIYIYIYVYIYIYEGMYICKYVRHIYVFIASCFLCMSLCISLSQCLFSCFCTHLRTCSFRLLSFSLFSLSLSLALSRALSLSFPHSLALSSSLVLSLFLSIYILTLHDGCTSIQQVNKLEARLTAIITGNQELTNELNRHKLLNKDLSLEKMEHEIEIERLRLQLQMKVGTAASASYLGLTRSTTDASMKPPSILQKMTEHKMTIKGFDVLRENYDVSRELASASAAIHAKESTSVSALSSPSIELLEIERDETTKFSMKLGHKTRINVSPRRSKDGTGALQKAEMDLLREMPVKWNDVSSLMLHHVDNILAVKYRTQKRHVDEWLAVSTISK